MPLPPMDELHAALRAGLLIPYLGPGVLALLGPDTPLPASPAALAACLTARVSVPHKLRGNVTGAAQFIENFKHRKTLVGLMKSVFAGEEPVPALHRFLAAQPALKLLVHAWYDNLPLQALAASREDWCAVQAASQSEHYGEWTITYGPDGTRQVDTAAATILYQPLGAVTPAANFLVSDSDFVEVLTEIDIQTPIPECVQNIRAGRHFLFLGCRFSSQLERIFAHQVTKRSSARHWAVLPDEPTRNEARFMVDHGIERIGVGLEEFVEALIAPSLAAV